MEGNFSLIIIIVIVAFRLLGPLLKSLSADKSRGQQQQQARVVLEPEPEPQPEPLPGRAIDPWAFEREDYSETLEVAPFEEEARWPERGFKYEPVRSYEPELPDKELKEDKILSSAAMVTTDRKPSRAFTDLRQTLSRKDKLVAAFIFHEILEPAPSVKRRKRIK